MNNHLFTHWPGKGLIECTCGWSRRAKTGAPAARRQHAKHVKKMGHLEVVTVLKIPRVPFTADAV